MVHEETRDLVRDWRLRRTHSLWNIRCDFLVPRCRMAKISLETPRFSVCVSLFRLPFCKNQLANASFACTLYGTKGKTKGSRCDFEGFLISLLIMESTCVTKQLLSRACQDDLNLPTFVKIGEPTEEADRLGRIQLVCFSKASCITS